VLILLVLKIGASFWQTTHVPTYEFDAWNNWDLRAKVISVEGRIQFDKNDEFYLGGGIKSYPLNDGLWKVWQAAVLGGWQEQAVNTTSVFVYIFLLGLFYFSLPENISTNWRLGSTYLFASLPFLYFHSWIPYADLEFAAYLFLTVAGMYHYLRDGHAPHLVLSALALGLSIWTKNEGFAVLLPVIVAALALALLRKQMSLRRAGYYIATAVVVVLPWLVFRFVNHLDLLSGDSSSFRFVFNRQFLGTAFNSIFLASHFNFLWLLAFGLAVTQIKTLRRNFSQQSLVFILFASFLFYNGIIIFTDKAYDLSALVRVNLQIAPLAMFYVVIAVRGLFEPLPARDK